MPIDLPCADCGKLMYRVAKSLPAGLARCHPCRRVARDLAPPTYARALRPCSRCGTPRHVGRTSRAEIVCLPCRRLLRQPKHAKQPVDCHQCRGPVPIESGRKKYCSDGCFQAARRAKGHGFSGARRSPPEERGYGKEHRDLRAKLLPLAYGTPCALCGEVMDEGDELHLDHNEDRSDYRGMVHGSCNRRDGARRGRARQKQEVLERGWRPGQDPSLRRRTRIGA